MICSSVNDKLTTLSVRGRTGLTTTYALRSALSPIISALSSAQHLTTIDISGNAGGDDIAHALGTAITCNSSLQTLYWDGNKTDVAGYESFLSGIDQNYTLINMQPPAKDICRAHRQCVDGHSDCLEEVMEEIAMVLERNNNKRGGPRRMHSMSASEWRSMSSSFIEFSDGVVVEEDMSSCSSSCDNEDNGISNMLLSDSVRGMPDRRRSIISLPSESSRTIMSNNGYNDEEDDEPLYRRDVLEDLQERLLSRLQPRRLHSHSIHRSFDALHQQLRPFDVLEDATTTTIATTTARAPRIVHASVSSLFESVVDGSVEFSDFDAGEEVNIDFDDNSIITQPEYVNESDKTTQNVDIAEKTTATAAAAATTTTAPGDEPDAPTTTTTSSSTTSSASASGDELLDEAEGDKQRDRRHSAELLRSKRPPPPPIAPTPPPALITTTTTTTTEDETTSSDVQVENELDTVTPAAVVAAAVVVVAAAVVVVAHHCLSSETSRTTTATVSTCTRYHTARTR